MKKIKKMEICNKIHTKLHKIQNEMDAIEDDQKDIDKLITKAYYQIQEVIETLTEIQKK